MTYNVFSGTLNPTQLINLSVCPCEGDWMFCTSIITVYLGLQSISAYGLVGIAVTRYISIREPLLFNERVTHCRALAAAAALWIILLVTSAALYFRLTPDGTCHRCDQLCTVTIATAGLDRGVARVVRGVRAAPGGTC